MIVARYAQKLAAILAAGRALSRKRRRRLHRHPPDRRRRDGRPRADARIRHRPSVRRPRLAARLRARRHHAGRPGRPQVESEICERRGERRRPADPHRRRQRGRARGGIVLLPDHRRLSGLRPGGRGQDHRALAIGLMASRQFRQRRRGQGQYRLDPRRRDGAQAMGLLAARPRRRPRRHRARASSSNMSAASSTSTTMRLASSPIRRASTGT